MSNPRVILVAFAVAVLFGACASQPEPVEVVPTGPTPEEIEQARQDSILAAQEAAAAAKRAEEERLAREAERRAAAARATLTEMVFFDYDEAAIRSDTEAILREKAQILRANPTVRMRMEGHADERGTSEYNIALGNERAAAVSRFLTDFGLNASRFSTVSYGEEAPLEQGSTEEAWSRNRRVEFVITMGSEDIVGQ